MRALQKKAAEDHRLAHGFEKTQAMTPVNKALRNQMRELKTVVLRRDAYRCVLCGTLGVKFHVHHIKSWQRNPTAHSNNAISSHFAAIATLSARMAAMCIKEAIFRQAGGTFESTSTHWTCSDCGAPHDRDVNRLGTSSNSGAVLRLV